MRRKNAIHIASGLFAGAREVGSVGLEKLHQR
jgi:hypothetical protein